jgi:hypothetical protein
LGFDSHGFQVLLQFFTWVSHQNFRPALLLALELHLCLVSLELSGMSLARCPNQTPFQFQELDFARPQSSPALQGHIHQCDFSSVMALQPSFLTCMRWLDPQNVSVDFPLLGLSSLGSATLLISWPF